MNDNKTVFEIEFYKLYNTKQAELKAVKNTHDYTLVFKNRKEAYYLRLVVPQGQNDKKQVLFPAPHYPVDAVAQFDVKTENPEYPVDYFVFMYENPAKKCHDFLILSSFELMKLFESNAFKSAPDSLYDLLIWAFPYDFIFVASNLSPEGEWYLLGSGIAKDTDRNISKYLNRWNVL